MMTVKSKDINYPGAINEAQRRKMLSKIKAYVLSSTDWWVRSEKESELLFKTPRTYDTGGEKVAICLSDTCATITSSSWSFTSVQHKRNINLMKAIVINEFNNLYASQIKPSTVDEQEQRSMGLKSAAVAGGIGVAAYALSSNAKEDAGANTLNDSVNNGSAQSVAFDTNGDGVADAIGMLGDRNGDGLADWAGVAVSHDLNSDGIADGVSVLIDNNNDGTVDAMYAAVDRDGDGVIDSAAVAVSHDINGDGVTDAAAIAVDQNGDGVTDVVWVGIDQDNDGLIDAAAVGVDSDGDGVIDVVAVDVDADGSLDAVAVDEDGDGLLDTVFKLFE